jgi:mannose-6-phosphate isomerase
MQYPGKLFGYLQRYSWGREGHQSRIGQFAHLKGEQGPLAEYWLGAHTKGPASLVRDGGETVELTKALEQEPARMLGSRWHPGMPATVPFMVKVLSINEAFGLSIQTHPDKAVAARLHAEDPAHYPDDNHKPELGVALTPTTILYGFKGISELLDIAQRLPELRGVLGYDLKNRLEAGRIRGESKEAIVRELVARLYAATPDVIADAVQRIAQRTALAHHTHVEESIIMRLRSTYSDADVGLLMLCVMNVVTMQPGEGIFIAANVPHAYLAGDIVECMACSDNVVRAGLTTKFRDDATLLAITAYETEKPTLLRPSVSSEGWMHYPAGCEEFRLSVAPNGSTPLVVSKREVPAIVLALGSRVVVRCETDSSYQVELADGEALFVPPGGPNFLLERVDAAVYHAEVGCP